MINLTRNTLFLLLFILSGQFLLAQENYEWKIAKSGDYEYKYVENDPSHTRFYKLENGLTVMLSPSHEKPRIQSFIAIKAGSKTDPSTHTGLAHYLEHMLFKGTRQFGSLDWEKEEPLLEQIEQLYEKYNSTTDEARRNEIYNEIDRISGEAAKYAIANEYDKLMAGMGAKGTNAFTSFEETVYTEDIPSNAVDKYLAVQAERFRDPVFRLFHTELEAVYEEKNRSLDSDGSKVFEKMFELLFPNNNYGKQTTIGTIHDLKNPSLIEIRKYFETYYVPNNMGIIMAGDFDPDEMIQKIDQSFSYMKSKAIPEYTFQPEEEIKTPISAEVFGPEPANVMLGYRFPGASSDDAQMLSLIGEMLTNGSAGLIDLNLVKKQKLLDAFAFSYILKDYSTLLLGGNPTEGQSLEEVKKLLLMEIDKLKSGDFSDDIITSIINNEKKKLLEVNENYTRRAYGLMNNFTLDEDWKRSLNYINALNKITKKDVIAFANKYFHDNYVTIYKRQGEDKDVVKVEKPTITPVEVNRNEQSDFVKNVAAIPENIIEPIWLDYDKDIERASAGKYDVLAVQDKDKGLFKLTYYYETGDWSNKLFPIAVDYLEYLGTKDKSAEDFSKEFYRLASSFYLWVSSENTYILLDGLQSNFEQTVSMFDDLLKNCVADKVAFKSYIKSLKQSRIDDKEDKWQIKNGLQNYATYGSQNPFNNVLTDKELDQLKVEDLIQILHNLSKYEHKILYFGPKSAEEISKELESNHVAPATFTELPKPYRFKQVDQNENKVLLAHYDMVQAEIFWVRNNEKYDPEMSPKILLFNEYFGSGMNSLVFQTIRESKALAYSSYAFLRNPTSKEDRTEFTAYIGTQSDKFSDAVDAMNELLTTLPESKSSVELARTGLRKKIASERIIGISIIYDYLNAQKKGRDYDVRKDTYEGVENMGYEDLNKFFTQQISNKAYTYCILTGKGSLDKEKLDSLGEVKELTLKEIFGY